MRLTQVPLVPQFSQNSPVLMETNPLNSIILLTPLISVEHMGKLNSPVLTESSNLITGKRHIFLVGGLEQFGTYFIFPYVGNHNLNWLIIFRGVETTNRIPNAKRDFFPHVWAILLQVYGYSHVSRDQASAVPWTRKSVNGSALLGTSHPETMFPPPPRIERFWGTDMIYHSKSWFLVKDLINRDVSLHSKKCGFLWANIVSSAVNKSKFRDWTIKMGDFWVTRDPLVTQFTIPET